MPREDLEEIDRRPVGRLVQVSQHVDDPDRAAAFYTNLLGVSPASTQNEAGQVFYLVGGVRLLLGAAAQPALIYFQVDSVQVTVAQLRQTGVEVVEEPRIIFLHTDDRLGPAQTQEWGARIRDSEGNIIGLSSFETSGSA